ncbi:uracil-DNA glycosylase [Flavicella sp.]|uniref:uracil-DNA glycosylase n=1 Tax=Flavicella sp. TaxID=2957742 RepID=UPI0026268643|nr:uracil-DNA glycosylase [Flavicella sp.]MDG1805262.1 uracil-DNA glycosylase [Flavicella sp.]
MVENLSLEWRNILKEEFQKPYFKELEQFVENAYSNEICFPEKKHVFEAFNQCSLADVKVVLLGQDPYHDLGQAHGLSFSVLEGVKHPPSLKNIFKELETDVGFMVPDSGNLSHWAKQGVLLLNATLTVEVHKAGSHQKKGWEKFTDAVIKKISEDCENVVFLLWGGYAQKKGKKIDATKHWILTSGHPSPLSANRGYWFGNKHFSKTNAFLKSKNKTEINW